MSFGSLFHIASVFFLAGMTAAFYFVFRKRSKKAQRAVIFTLMLLNLSQHFLKSLIYPHYRGQGFNINSTAYNMCAFLIIFMPLAFFLKNRSLKNFFFFSGAFAGATAIIVPFWFFGSPVRELGWEYVRFYLCHALLHITSILPLLWAHHRPAFREFWQPGICFLTALSVIFLNNVVFILLGYSPGVSPDAVYDGLLRHNVCSMVAPAESMQYLGKIARLFTLPQLAGDNPSGRYAPILWYAFPVYLGITAASAVLFALIDRRSFAKKPKSIKQNQIE